MNYKYNNLEMKKIGTILKKRIYDLFFFIYITTFISLLGFIDENILLETYLSNNIYSLGIGLLLFIMSLFFAQKGRTVFLSMILIYTFPPSVIVLSYLIIGKAFMVRSNFFPIFETSIRESMEFINSYVGWEVILILILFFCYPVLYIIKTRNESHKINHLRIATIKIKYVYILLFYIAFVFIPYFTHHRYQTEYAPFTSLYANYYAHKRFISKVKKYDTFRKDQNLYIKSDMPNDISKTFVIVIGESLTRKHMSIYGYHRNTTPLLNLKKDELLVFRDVISPNTNTIGSLKIMLTFATNKNEEAYFIKPSVIELFNYAGYETYWIGNQASVSRNESIYGILAAKAKHMIDLTQKTDNAYDEFVLNSLTDILDNGQGLNKVIFIHLLGNHLKYKDRYPLLFNKFDNLYPFDSTKIDLNENQKKIINEYDNSVLYNDFVISSIIDLTKKYAPFSYVLYLSDHAQELFDIRDCFGHSYNYSKYECNIPFILWRSDNYKKQVKLFEGNIDTPYTTEDVIYSISQLSGLLYEEYDDTKSIFSDQFKEKRRMVGNKFYEDLKE